MVAVLVTVAVRIFPARLVSVAVLVTVAVSVFGVVTEVTTAGTRPR